MANMWSIRIVTLPDGTVAFQPDIPGAQPGQPLGAEKNDLVTWNNQTNAAHWPVVAPPQTTPFLTDSIPAGEVSSPIFQVTATVDYICSLHPEEKGSIVVGAGLIA